MQNLIAEAGGTYAKIIADSISESTGDRLTSFEIRFHRFCLAELNTHCVAGDTVLEFDMPTALPNGGRRAFKMTIAEFVDKWQNGSAPRANKGGQGTNRQPMRDRLAQMRLRQLDEQTGLVVATRIVDARATGQEPVYEVKTYSGHRIQATADHLFFTSDQAWQPLEVLQVGDEVVVKKFGKRSEDLLDPNRLRMIGGVWRAQWQRDQRRRLIAELNGCRWCGSTKNLEIHHVVPVHVNVDLAFDKDNVTLICEDCHHRAHADQSSYPRGGTYLYGAVDRIVSIKPAGTVPVYDIEVEGPFHNFLANGVVVHNCVFARNSASSRAIPVEKQLERYEIDPAYPLVWASEQKGMSGGAELQDGDRTRAIQLWQYIHRMTATAVHDYLRDVEVVFGPEAKRHRLHKSLINRLLEPMQWHTALVTSATYENFFDQRVSPAAQPELKAVAELMKELYDVSEPVPLKAGEWHLPYVHGDEEVVGTTIFETDGDDGAPEADAREVCSARCARTSYMNQAGEREFSEDLRLYHDTLLAGPHWSPLEHVATPRVSNIHTVPIIDPDNGKRLGMRRLPRLGKFPGFAQWRHIVEGRLEYVSYR